MPPQARIGDASLVPVDAHGCPGCPHSAVGPAISGSPDVLINGRPALRVGDTGIHAACCGGNNWTAKTGSRSVFINGRAAHRLGDMVTHCGGIGRTIEGSSNVIVGDLSFSIRAAQTPIKKRRAGFLIRDDEGKPVPNLEVILSSPDGSDQRVFTDQDGKIHIPDAQPGTYHIQVVSEESTMESIGKLNDLEA